LKRLGIILTPQKKPTENSFHNTKKHLVVVVAMLEKADFK